MQRNAMRVASAAAAVAVVAVAVCAAWTGAAWRAGYVLDDGIVIQGNPVVAWPPDLARIAAARWFPDPDEFGYVVLSRPLATLSYSLELPLGLGTARGRHLVNLGLYVACCAALGALLYALLQRKHPRRAPWLAALGGLGFAALPVHTEVVLGVANRPELLAALALIAATGALLGIARGRSGVAPWLAFGLAWAAALLSKESALGALGAWAAWAFAARGDRRVWRALGLATVVAAAWWAFRRATFGAVLQSFIPTTDNPLVALPTAARVGYGVRQFGVAAWQALGPPDDVWLGHAHRLAPDHTWQPMRETAWADPWLAAGLVLAMAFTWAGVRLAWQARRAAPASDGTPVASAVVLGLALAACTWLPVSNWLFPSTTFFADRLLFLPTLGMAIALVAALAGAPIPTERATRTLLGLGAAFATTYLLACLRLDASYADQWTSPAKLYAHRAATPLLRQNLALVRAEQGDLAGAAAALGCPDAPGCGSPRALTQDLELHTQRDQCDAHRPGGPLWRLARRLTPATKPSLAAIDYGFRCRQFAEVWAVVRHLPARRVSEPWPRRVLALAAAAGDPAGGAAWVRPHHPDALSDPAWAAAAVFGLETGGHALRAVAVLAELQRRHPSIQGLDRAAADLSARHRFDADAGPLYAAVRAAFPAIELPAPPTIAP
ncbi:MAG: hypothetical protein EXR79_04100 [Myxococcales bacterium]|nr:hypothetical protein [Myxococcales bacterium]